MDWFETIWGTGDKLGVLAMSVRAFCAFMIMLIIIRVGGMRIFGKESAFDSIITIMMGAILTRGVVGASPFLSSVGACVVIVVVHRLLSILSIRSETFSDIVKGKKLLLYEKGKFIYKNMRKGGISKGDVTEILRIEMNTENLENIDKVFMERNGHLSFIKTDE